MRFHMEKLLVCIVILLLASCSNPVSTTPTEEPTSKKTFVVTEILYNNGIDSLEFIELKNVSFAQQSLKGMFFSQGIDFKFADDAVIEKGQYLVLTNSNDLFTKKYPGVKIAGVYTGKLTNNGEIIELSGADLKKVISVEYGSSGFWPALADGLGYSLVTKNESDAGDQNDYKDWIASATSGGSPGEADQAKSSLPVYVNEIMVSSLTDRTDKIELFNPSQTQSVDVSYYFLTDDKKLPRKFQIPAGSVLPPNSYLVFTFEQFKNQLNVSNAGGSVYLFGGKADSSLTGFSNGIDFDGADAGTTIGLIKNGDGKFFTSILTTPTIGSANSSASMGSIVISEIMYHPSDSGTEFIEIANTSTDSVLLYANNLSWKVKGASFEFPPNTTLKGNSVCLLIDSSTTVSSFRIKYAIDPTVLIFQFDGKLSNDSEEIAIEKPGKLYYDAFNVVQCPYITVDAVSYQDKSPWPKTADGDGYTLIRKDLTIWGNEPSNWRASDLKGGTPGKL